MRLAFGAAGLAAASAIATAIVTPGSTPAGPVPTGIAVSTPTPLVLHVTRIVHLLPGQTPPPSALVTQLPAPSPRTVIITTRQSGAKP